MLLQSHVLLGNAKEGIRFLNIITYVTFFSHSVLCQPVEYPHFADFIYNLQFSFFPSSFLAPLFPFSYFHFVEWSEVTKTTKIGQEETTTPKETRGVGKNPLNLSSFHQAPSGQRSSSSDCSRECHWGETWVGTGRMNEVLEARNEKRVHCNPIYELFFLILPSRCK